MTDTSWDRLADIFSDALELAPEKRDAFLDRTCTRPDGSLDADLRKEASRLVTASEAADATGALTSPLSGFSGSGDALPEQIGPWRVTGLLGEGGAGVVYSAERADGQIDRTVALKVLRRAGRAVARQFDRERRALALLEHPNIARLYDADVVRDGPYRDTPFLVMERVEGLPISTAADQLGLNAEARIRLILQVCEAVGFAHGRLVLHRDLKPSNVLVAETENGARAVVLDFGVARLLGDERDDALTRTASPAYTPAYAAPEQLTGGEITTATDVHGIGSLLYELLAGCRPFVSLTDIEIRTSRLPSAPSTVAPSERTRQLVGDLDTICLKALDPDPARRYASVDALANDLRRHLDGLPIEARPATVRYRMGRFIGRNRSGVAATALIALAILGGLGAALWQQAEAQLERDRAQLAAIEAQQQAERAEAVAGFLEQILRAPNTRWYNESTATGPETPIRAVLDEAAVRVDQDFADQPDLLADLHHILGDTYGALNLPEEALRHHRRTLALRESIYDAPHPKIAEALYYVASRRDSLLLSLDYMERALAMLRVRNEGNNFPFIAHDLAGRYQAFGRPVEAVAVTTEGIDFVEERFVPGTDGHRYRDTILAMLFRARATALLDLGRVDEAAVELARDDSLLASLPRTQGYYVSWRSHICQTGRLRRLQERLTEAEAALLACLGDSSPQAQVSPFPIPDSDPSDNLGLERVGTMQLVALYDATGRTTEADRYRLRAEVAQAHVDSLLAVER